MATTYSETDGTRRGQRRRATIDEALDHAVDIMGEAGVGAVTVSEVARRMGVKPPSLYKYFPSLHALYDAAFARGLRAHDAAVHDAVRDVPRGARRIRAGIEANVRWSVANPALAQLMFWRPVPGFAPSAETFEVSIRSMAELRGEFAVAVELGEIPDDTDIDAAARLLTVVISGLISQQMANEPGVAYADGSFTRLTGHAIDMYFDHLASLGGPHADTGSRPGGRARRRAT